MNDLVTLISALVLIITGLFAAYSTRKAVPPPAPDPLKAAVDAAWDASGKRWDGSTFVRPSKSKRGKK